jgi:serine protease Do
MATFIDDLVRGDLTLDLRQLSEDLSALVERVRASVVVVRGSRNGTGSGVVWDDQGLIVTNHHVVPGPRAEVLPGKGVRLSARVLARAESLDLAVLQVDGSIPDGALVAATIGDSTLLRPGELVVAVGNPLGERNAATLGVISGTGSVTWPGGSREVIRASIALRPGNSGGALADARGHIVGIPHMVVGGDLALAVPTHAIERFLRASTAAAAISPWTSRYAIPTM